MAITMPGKDVPVRLISYLTTHPGSKDTTYVLGGFANVGGGTLTVLRQLAHADDESTIFYADSQADPLGVRLYWGKDRSQFICWSNVKEQCFFTSNKNMLIREASILAVAAWRTDPWLTLSDWNDRRDSRRGRQQDRRQDARPRLATQPRRQPGLAHRAGQAVTAAVRSPCRQICMPAVGFSSQLQPAIGSLLEESRRTTHAVSAAP